MRIEIEIPKEFECDYDADRFSDFFSRAIIDIETMQGMCGRYEVETALMLRTAFHTSKVAYDVEAKVAELEKEYDLADKEKARCMEENIFQYDEAKGYARGIDTAIEIVRERSRG